MRTLLLLLLAACTLSAAAQTKIVGFVKLQSSGNQALPNAEVWAIGAASKPLRFSNTKGYFELEFPSKKAGDVIREVTVTLDGYEVVNKKDLESYGLLSQPEDNPLIIVLCKQGEYRKAAADYYQTIYHAGEAELQAEKKRLEQALEQERKNRSALEQQLTDINKKLENLPQVAEAAADYFAKIDRDQATQLQKNALAELERGNIQAALDAMPEDVMDKTMADAQQRKQQLEAQLAEVNQVIKQSIENYLFKARLYVSTGDYNAAERLYEKAIAADTTNIENIYDYAIFLEDINRYDKALLWLQKVTVAKTDAWRIANAWGTMGQVYEETGDFINAPHAYARAESLYDSLYRREPANDFYKGNLAISYEKLGSIYQAQGNFDTALVYFQRETDLFEELYRDNPKSESLKNGLAISYSKLGDIYQAQGNFDTALVYFQRRSQLGEELYRDNPKNVDLWFGLGVSYYKLGALSVELDKTEEAIGYYEQAAQVFREMFAAIGLEQYKNFHEALEAEIKKLKEPANPLLQKIQTLEQQVAKATLPADKVKYQQELVQLLQGLVDAAPDNQGIKAYTANAYGGLAWHALFTQQFQEAEQAARQGITLGGTAAEWIHTNLALALLYQGKYAAAEAIYRRLKDQPYGDDKYAATFLSDLDELEAAGITHEDVARVRALLRE